MQRDFNVMTRPSWHCECDSELTWRTKHGKLVGNFFFPSPLLRLGDLLVGHIKLNFVFFWFRLHLYVFAGPGKQEAQAHAARVEADNAKRVIEAERLAVEQANFQKVRVR